MKVYVQTDIEGVAGVTFFEHRDPAPENVLHRQRMQQLLTGEVNAAVSAAFAAGATVVDVRTPAEYESGHYKGAQNIPLQELPGRLAEVGDKTNAIVVYCASGMRSARAAKILTAAGFTDVTNAGGLQNLAE